MPDLQKVNITIGIFDKENVLHRLLVGAYFMICNILQREIHQKNFYKSIFTIVKYENKIVFMGDLNFDGVE